MNAGLFCVCSIWVVLKYLSLEVYKYVKRQLAYLEMWVEYVAFLVSVSVSK